MRQNFDREGKINVINWLRALGIPNQTIQIKNVAKKAPPVKNRFPSKGLTTTHDKNWWLPRT